MTSLEESFAGALQLLEAAGCAPAEPLKLPLAEARARQDRYFEYLNQDAPDVHSATDLNLPGPAGVLRLRVLHPAEWHSSAPVPTVIFVRGAGWWAGGLTSHERTARVIARCSGAACVVLDYHRTPEHRQPTQLNELLAAIAWVRAEGRAHGLDPQRVVLWGESAGATLSVLAAQRLRDAGHPPVQALVLFYGNFDGPGPTTRAQSLWVWQQYLGEDFDHPPPEAIPARQPVHGLPPAWLGVGDRDALLQDTLSLHERLMQTGALPNTLALRVWPGLPHGFMTLNRILPVAQDAVAEAWAFAARHLPAAAKTD